LIVRGSLNFWTGSTTERNLEESSEEANEHRKLGGSGAFCCAEEPAVAAVVEDIAPLQIFDGDIVGQ
jgi:hypothetical protein